MVSVLIAIEADDVSINGFELDGNNPNLNDGEDLNGVDANVAYGILTRAADARVST
ncbi:MAG: hypothetical protein U5L04_05575 [Trueperaceae bacterium]|nr:hypothetical protein [Trueperaceae bacterium]